MTWVLAMISWIFHQRTGNKSKSRQVGLHKTKKGFAKEIINRVKGHIQNEKILLNHISDQKLTCK